MINRKQIINFPCSCSERRTRENGCASLQFYLFSRLTDCCGQIVARFHDGNKQDLNPFILAIVSGRANSRFTTAFHAEKASSIGLSMGL